MIALKSRRCRMVRRRARARRTPRTTESAWRSESVLLRRILRASHRIRMSTLGPEAAAGRMGRMGHAMLVLIWIRVAMVVRRELALRMVLRRRPRWALM